MQRPDTPDGLFHAGNPATGQKGTPITAEWLNALISVGALFHGTANPPDPGLGDEGDHYINSAAQLIFGPKTAGAWGAGSNFKGLKGDTGLTGPTGNPYKAYASLAAANTDLANIPADALIWVNADATAANIGYWSKTGGVLVPSSYDRVALVEKRASTLEGESSPGTMGNISLSFKTSRFTANSVLTYASATSTFAGWASAVTYAGESFDVISVALQVDSAKTKVRLSVRRADLTTIIVSTTREVGVSGIYNFVLPSRLGANDIPDAVFYVSVESVGHTAHLKNPGTNGNNTARIADLNTYPSKYAVTGSVDGAGWVNVASAIASNTLVLAFYDTAVDATTMASLKAEVDSIAPNVSRQFRQGFVPYVQYQPPQGLSEVGGDATYGSAKVIGARSVALTEATTFNAITIPVWCTDPAANIEWRVYLKDYTVSFDTTVDYADSGTIPGADFPHSASQFTLQLNQVMTAQPGKYVYCLFRATNDASLAINRWLYNAAITPARAGFPFSLTAGWGASLSYGVPGSGYGQPGMLLLMESDELRAKGGASSSAQITYDPAMSGLTSTNVKSAIDEIAAHTASTALSIAIPPDIWSVVGHEFNIYNDNIIAMDASDYRFNYVYTPTDGVQQSERFNLIPVAAQSVPLTVNLHSKSGETPIASVTTTVTSKPAAVGTGINRKCLFIGDSTTAGGTYTAELLNLFGAGDPMDITLIGTKGSAGNLFEATGGWTIAMFMAATSPFYFAGAFNFSQYMTTNGFSGLDYVFIHLGINDVFGFTTDAEVAAAAVTMLSSLESMITSIHAYSAAIKIGIMLTIPPSATQDAFAANYQSGQTRWRYKRNIVMWANLLIDQFQARQGSGIYVVPVNCNIDTVNNMSVAAATPVNSRNAATVVRQNNGVHPAAPGYYQMADTVYAFLKCQEN